MIGGHAVLEAVRPAGVLGHVAADGAGALARGIGDVVQPVRAHRFGEPRVDHAGFHHGPPVRRDDREDPVHPGQGDQHRVALGERAAREAGAGAARHERHAPASGAAGAPPRPPPWMPGSTTMPGQRLVGRQAVGGIGGQLGGPVPDPPRPDDAPQRRDQGFAVIVPVTMSWPVVALAVGAGADVHLGPRCGPRRRARAAGRAARAPGRGSSAWRAGRLRVSSSVSVKRRHLEGERLGILGPVRAVAAAGRRGHRASCAQLSGQLRSSASSPAAGRCPARSSNSSTAPTR